MDNFNLFIPTHLHFGKNVLDDLGKTITEYGKKVLLVYGQQSIKKNGIYNAVIAQLNLTGAEIFEYSGIKSNPVITAVNEAAELGRKNNIDVILAVGGGSVIDSSKIISITIPQKKNAWGFFSGTTTPKKAIPLIAVLTLSATGTEMNAFAVVQNEQTQEKPGYGHPLLYPKHSFLDPQNTFSVSKKYTAFGLADTIAHALEAYFGKGDASLSDKIAIAVIKEVMECGPLLLANLTDYELRAKMMYAATVALNGNAYWGKSSGDWGVHSVGHCLSVLYDTPHGASLTIAYPAWMRLQKTRIPERLSQFGNELFGISDVDETIHKLEQLFIQLCCPVRLADINITANQHSEIKKLLIKTKPTGSNHRLIAEDYQTLIELMSIEKLNT